MAQSSPSPPLRSRTANGGAKRYLEQRRQQQNRQLLQQRRQSVDGADHRAGGRTSTAESNVEATETIRLFLESLEAAEAEDRQLQQPKFPAAAASTRRASLDWSEERFGCWRPPPDTRRELLAAAEQHLQATTSPAKSEAGSGDTDSEPESCYVPRSVFDFKSRAAWKPSARPRPGTNQLPRQAEQHENLPASAKSPSHLENSSEAPTRSLSDSPEHQTRASSGAPTNHNEHQPRASSGAPTGRHEHQQQASPRAADSSQNQPARTEWESRSCQSEVPRLEQLRALRQAPAYSKANPPTDGAEVDPNRRLFIVKRYHPAEVPNNFISATCSQFDDQMSETSV
ncbi:hypothetical protein BOX15_Mlig006297g1 [Macrostomum lignano]|uniref:Uncharacterized protein n=1 Tax=Macrostomum lignano TaxID=282301 RepID=A0A267EWL5_9PLAT|nr:hypothetical protein BOX15_Mlig006297g1 [Macrostomum lignano]